jgi:hypothetical protein
VTVTTRQHETAEKEGAAKAKPAGPESTKEGETAGETPATRSIINVEKSIQAIENWKQGVAGSVADSNIAAKVGAFVPFFAADLLKRSVQLGDLLFGVTTLQDAVQVIADPTRSAIERIKSGAWALFTVGMSFLMISGVANKVGAKLAGMARSLKKQQWVQKLSGSFKGLVDRSFGFVRSKLPRLVEKLKRGGKVAEQKLSGLINTVRNSDVWKSVREKATKKVPLPSAVEALSTDLRALIRQRVSDSATRHVPKAGLGPKTARDVEGAITGGKLTKSSDELTGLSNRAKGELGEAATRSVMRLKGWRVPSRQAPAREISKYAGNQGVDHVLVKPGTGQKAVVESKATSSASKKLGLLTKNTVKSGDPLNEIGVHAGAEIRQASRAFNFDRLAKLARVDDAQKARVAQSFINDLSTVEDLASATRLTEGEFVLMRLQMSDDLLSIDAAEEILKMTFGDVRDTYYIMVLVDFGQFGLRGVAPGEAETDTE